MSTFPQTLNLLQNYSALYNIRIYYLPFLKKKKKYLIIIIIVFWLISSQAHGPTYGQYICYTIYSPPVIHILDPSLVSITPFIFHIFQHTHYKESRELLMAVIKLIFYNYRPRPSGKTHWTWAIKFHNMDIWCNLLLLYVDTGCFKISETAESST